MGGPLSGVKVVEVAGLGAAPFCGMILADMGAQVIRVDRVPSMRGDDPGAAKDSFVDRGRQSVSLNLKTSAGLAALHRLIETCDVVIEAFRPGVAERLGFGPDACLQRNERLVYGRMTGWGQHGTLSRSAGHDLNYIAISGALHAIGSPERPMPPLNLLGDYGGGGLLLALGIVGALLERSRTGKGQVVDAAMSDGAALLMTEIFSQYAAGAWTGRRQDNLLDGGAPFYGVYECADGKFVSVAAIEARFFAQLLSACGFEGVEPRDQWDRSRWPSMRQAFADRFRGKSRDEWCRLLEGTDACFAPVLDLDEAPRHAHNRARATFRELDGKPAPAPAPRFSLHADASFGGIATIGADTSAILTSVGYSQADIRALLERNDAFQDEGAARPPPGPQPRPCLAISSSSG